VQHSARQSHKRKHSCDQFQISDRVLQTLPPIEPRRTTQFIPISPPAASQSRPSASSSSPLVSQSQIQLIRPSKLAFMHSRSLPSGPRNSYSLRGERRAEMKGSVWAARDARRVSPRLWRNRGAGEKNLQACLATSGDDLVPALLPGVGVDFDGVLDLGDAVREGGIGHGGVGEDRSNEERVLRVDR